MKRVQMKRILALFIALIVCISLVACGDSSDHVGEAKTPSGSSVQQGRNYLDVVEDFQDHGFTNIQTEAIDDLVLGWLTEDGEVEKVTVDGDENYSADTWVASDVEVIIFYHTFPQESSQPEQDTNDTGSSEGEVTSDDEASSETIIPSTDETRDEDENKPTDSDQNASAVVPPDNSTFSVKFIDVGQADAALIECDGHYMLVDGGNKGDSSLIYTVLKNAGITYLDIVVGTHAHEDHIGGLPGAFNYATAGLTLCPVKSYDSDAFEDFAKYADQNGNGITIPSVGDTYSLGSATVSILGLNAGDETNDTSIVLKVQYGETSFLFTGDAEREAEQAILNSGADLSSTVLKVGHHGSDTSTTYPFLREIMPLYAVISVGKDNSYEHPTDNTLSRLRDADVTVFRTDLHGDIVFTSDGKTVSVSTDKTASEEDVMTPGGSIIIPPTTTTPDPEPEQGTDTQPSGTDYVVNTNTGKFHYPSCSSVKKMKESNKMFYTGTRDDLVSQGYSPCGNCHP